MVVDTSALADYLLQTSLATSVRDAVGDSWTQIHAPCGIDLEIASVLRRLVLNGVVDLARAMQATDHFWTLPIRRHSRKILISRGLQLRDNFSSYDAAFAALAELLTATLVTTDERFARTVRAHLPHVEVRP